MCNSDKAPTTGLKPPPESPHATEHASPSQSLAPPGEPFLTPRCNVVQIQPESRPNGSTEAIPTPTPLAQPSSAALAPSQAVTPSVASAPTVLLSPLLIPLIVSPMPQHAPPQSELPVCTSSPDAAPPVAAPSPDPSPAPVDLLPSLQVPVEATHAANLPRRSDQPRFHDEKLQVQAVPAATTPEDFHAAVRVVTVPNDDAETPQMISPLNQNL